MSYLKFSSNQFLEKQELDRLWKFIYNDGFRKHLLDNTYSYGIIREKEDINFNNFKVKEGTNNGTIQITRPSYALDEGGNLIFKQVEDNIDIPDDNNWYWVKISHKFSPEEQGTIDIDVNGNITGTDTEFTKILRGGANVPSVVAFTNSSNNIQEYEVLEVIDDENAILSGVSGAFTAESGLKYKIVGSFTPDYVPSTAQKDIFQYDSAILELIEENPQGTQDSPNVPTKELNYEFFIARVNREASTLVIQDKRNEFWRYKADYELNKDITSDNPLVGVEAVKWDSQYSTRVRNIVEIGWGFRTNTFTWNASLNKISISNGIGGRYKGVSDFNNNDFNGWRIYFTDGSYSLINSSQTNGSQIDLILDNFDPNKVTNGDDLTVVPDVEQIELYVQDAYDSADSDFVNDTYTFNIEHAFGKLHLLVPETNDGFFTYSLQYRYKNFGQYSEWEFFNDSTYLDENQFDEYGFLKNNFSYTQTGSRINLYSHPNSYYQRINAVDTGDRFGVNEITLSSNNSVRDFIVGQDVTYQIINGDNISLSGDQILNLSTEGAQELNNFTFDFRGLLNFNGNNVLFTQDYDGNGSPSNDQASISITNAGNDGDEITVQVKEYETYHASTYRTIGTYKRDATDTISDIAAGLSLDINNNTYATGYSSVALNDAVNITAPTQTEAWKKPSNFEINFNINGDIQANVDSGFQGGEILFKLSTLDLEKMLIHKSIYNFYFDGENWFANEEYRDIENTKIQTPELTDDGEVILTDRGKTYSLPLNHNKTVVGIISDYHYEGDEIYIDNLIKYDDSSNHQNKDYIANIYAFNAINANPIDAFQWVKFKKTDGLWYVVEHFEYFYDEISSVNNKIDNQESFKTIANDTVNGFENGASDASNTNEQSPVFMKDAMGFVHLYGGIDIGSYGNNNTKFTLPSGYRPSKDIILPTTDISNLEAAYILIKSNGEANFWSSNGGLVYTLSVPPFRAG